METKSFEQGRQQELNSPEVRPTSTFLIVYLVCARLIVYAFNADEQAQNCEFSIDLP